MFEIDYKGGNSVLVTTKKTKLWVDPNLELIGLKNGKLNDFIQLATEERFLVKEADATLQLEGPGEYEVGDVSIEGFAMQRHIDTPEDGQKTTMYRLTIGDYRIAILGNIAPTLTEDDLEAIGVVDVLVLPVGGGGYTLDATSATSVVRKVEPKIVVPVHYQDSAIKYEVPQDSVDTFISELSLPVETRPKLKVKSNSDIPATVTIVVLDRS